MANLTRSERIIAEKTVCILLVRGEDPDGESMYAYVAVRADKLEPFMEAQKNGTFYPEDYGVVVESGIGEPSEEVRTRMETDYGFNHEGMLNIPGPDDAHEITSNIATPEKYKPQE